MEKWPGMANKNIFWIEAWISKFNFTANPIFQHKC